MSISGGMWVGLQSTQSNSKMRQDLESALEFFGSLRFAKDIPENMYEEMFVHILAILNRPYSSEKLDIRLTGIGNSMEVDETQLVPSDDDGDCKWYSLAIPYNVFSRFLSLPPEPMKLKSLLKKELVSKILDVLLVTDDTEEKHFLKFMIHRIYKNFIHLRKHIRTMIKDVCIRVAYEGESFDNMDIVLAIYDSFIRGFALPLKNEHKSFLIEALLPLHRSPKLLNFHSSLVCCVEAFICSDPGMFPIVIDKLAKMWPNFVSQKQVLFMQELDRLVLSGNADVLNEMKIPIFHMIARAANSQNRLVAGEGLNLISRYYISDHTWDLNFEVLEIVVPALTSAAGHWDGNVKQQAMTYLSLLQQRIEPDVIKKLYVKQVAIEDAKKEHEKQMLRKWSTVEAMAVANMSLGIPLH